MLLQQQIAQLLQHRLVHNAAEHASQAAIVPLPLQARSMPKNPNAPSPTIASDRPMNSVPLQALFPGSFDLSGQPTLPLRNSVETLDCPAVLCLRHHAGKSFVLSGPQSQLPQPQLSRQLFQQPAHFATHANTPFAATAALVHRSMSSSVVAPSSLLARASLLPAGTADFPQMHATHFSSSSPVLATADPSAVPTAIIFTIARLATTFARPF